MAPNHQSWKHGTIPTLIPRALIEHFSALGLRVRPSLPPPTGTHHMPRRRPAPTLPAGKGLCRDPPVGDVGSDCRGAALSSVSQSCGGCWRRSRPPLTPTPRNRARRRRPTGPARISGRGPLPPARPLTCRHVGVSTPCRYVSFPFSWPSPHVPPFFCRFRGRLPDRYVTLTCGPRS